jgi:Fe-S-cluster formation regulator IscX/YfhJ
MNYEYDIEQKDRLINVLEAENTAMKLAIEEKDEKIADLDKWVCVLTDMQSSPSNEKVIEAVR